MDETFDIFNTGEILKKRAAEERRRRQKELNDTRKLLKIPEGRRFLWRMLTECGIYKQSFTLNAVQTAWNEGKRDIGLYLLEEINQADSSAFSQMQQEYLSALKSKQEAKEAQNDD